MKNNTADGKKNERTDVKEKFERLQETFYSRVRKIDTMINAAMTRRQDIYNYNLYIIKYLNSLYIIKYP